MENNTLDIIQTIAKVGKILSTVAYVFCLVGGILCAVGLVCIGIPGSIKINGVTIYSLFSDVSGLNVETGYMAMLTGIIICAAVCVVAKLAERYFSNELAAGTPFTVEGAHELLRLGICTIAVPLGAIVAANIINAIVSMQVADVAEIQIDGGAPVLLGVVLIVVSLICRYGAESKNGQVAVSGQ